MMNRGGDRRRLTHPPKPATCRVSDSMRSLR